MKYQAITQAIEGAICMKVQDGLYVTLVYREYTLAGWSHWMLIPIDKTPPQFLKPGDPGFKHRTN